MRHYGNQPVPMSDLYLGSNMKVLISYINLDLINESNSVNRGSLAGYSDGRFIYFVPING